jgi:heptosyltransferase-2
LPHLDKDRGADAYQEQRLKTLRDEVDLLICLRWDVPSDRLLTISDIEYHIPGPAVGEQHVTAEHRDLVMPFTRPYEIVSSYVFPGLTPAVQRPSSFGAVALCISAGFHLNAWPLCHWLSLAERLHNHRTKIVLLGGPDELGKLFALGVAIEKSLGYRPRTIAGGRDFGATLRQLHEVADLAIATDSGTAHLAALAVPVVSLFGGSPWNRFAPLGRFNAVLSRRLLCSPCMQFHRIAVNTCHTQECLSRLTPDQVYSCLTAYLAGIDLTRDVLLNGVWMAQAPWLANRRRAAA